MLLTRMLAAVVIAAILILAAFDGEMMGAVIVLGVAGIVVGLVAGLRSLAGLSPPAARPRDPGVCAKCGYDLSGLPGSTCPECGEFHFR